VSLGEQIAFKTLEPPDRLVRQPADLGELPRDRLGLRPDSVANGVLDSAGKRRLQIRGQLGKLLDLPAGPLQGGVDFAWLDAAVRRLCEASPGTPNCAFVHERNASV
jgi:hypothetical protein